MLNPCTAVYRRRVAKFYKQIILPIHKSIVQGAAAYRTIHENYGSTTSNVCEFHNAYDAPLHKT
jgi:hypothetical protein